MGNTHPGSNGSMPSQPHSPYQAPDRQYNQLYPSTITHPINSTGQGIPVPTPRSDKFEQELSSSLSGISGLSAHLAARNTPSQSGSFGDDFISPGQYMARYRSNSVSVDPEMAPAPLPEIKATLPAVVKWDKGGNNVSIAGSFNKWEAKLPLVKSTDNFYTIVDLEEGEHQYKYYVDGHWVINPDEPTVTDSHGNLNNVLRVRKSDFEIVDALETDSTAVSDKNHDSSSSYPQSDYGQEVPSRRTDRHVGPPVLPQHLLQVILNKDVSNHLEPGILPEPNHVMLNHLYALSIKDGVMVMSDTSRFRKKCVTTLLYKPIDQ